MNSAASVVLAVAHIPQWQNQTTKFEANHSQYVSQSQVLNILRLYSELQGIDRFCRNIIMQQAEHNKRCATYHSRGESEV